MNVLVSGASGLVGSKLRPLLEAAGHSVFSLVRRSPQNDRERQWNPPGSVDPRVFDGIDAVVHLAGDNIGAGRWTAAKKERIRASRVNGTRVLAEALAKAQPRPRSLICASAIGFYGNRGATVLDESQPAGTGFLPEVCVAWETAADAARAAGLRVVHLRLGVVLSPAGGALAAMLLPFKLCVGGIIGDGHQYWSCVSVDDAAAMFRFAVENETLVGPVNGVAPEPVTNREFTRVLGRVLGRPTIFPMPAFAARLALGEMAQDLILASTRVIPQQLTQAGFTYQHATLESALRAVLAR